jgi:hypothetical protein
VGASDYGIVLHYNTDVFAAGSQPGSTLDFFDVEQFPGKRCAFNFAQSVATSSSPLWPTVLRGARSTAY